MGLGSFLKKISPIGGILSGVGSILGATKSQSPSYRSYTEIVKDAKQAGIHPLFALGAQPQGIMSRHGSGISGIGQGITQLSSAITKSKSRLQTELTRAQINAARAQANRDNAAAARDYVMATNEEKAAGGKQTIPGISQHTSPVPVQPASIKARMPDGTIVDIPNQEIMESGELTPLMVLWNSWMEKQKANQKKRTAVNVKKQHRLAKQFQKKNVKGLFRGPRKLEGSKYWRQQQRRK